jgi:hypothetical protein
MVTEVSKGAPRNASFSIEVTPVPRVRLWRLLKPAKAAAEIVARPLPMDIEVAVESKKA